MKHCKANAQLHQFAARNRQRSVTGLAIARLPVSLSFACGLVGWSPDLRRFFSDYLSFLENLAVFALHYFVPIRIMFCCLNNHSPYIIELELELELILSQMAQKPMLRGTRTRTNTFPDGTEANAAG